MEEYNLSKSIVHMESIVVDYKAILKDLAMDTSLDKTDEFLIKYKADIRENLNFVEKYLRGLILEKTYENQGLNPPFCYKY